MTRRDFGAFVGMLGVAMMVKPEWIHAALRGRVPARQTRHIQNRRLLSFGGGNITLMKWEREHIHECEVCQEMLCVLMRETGATRV